MKPNPEPSHREPVPGRRFAALKGLAQTVLVLAVALLPTGCALVRAVNLASGKKSLTIGLDRVVFCGMQGDTLRLEVPLVLHNQTEGQALVTRIEIHGCISGKQVFAVSHDKELNIGPESTQMLEVPVDVCLRNIAKGFLNGSPVFSFDGGATVDLGLLGRRVIPFHMERRIFSPTRPRLSLRKASLGRSDLSTIRLTMVFDRAEDPNDKVVESSLYGSASINGTHVGSITEAGRGEQIAAEIAIPIKSVLFVARKLAKTKECSVKIDVLYEADTENMKYRIPYVFEQKDIVFPWKKERRKTEQTD